MVPSDAMAVHWDTGLSLLWVDWSAVVLCGVCLWVYQWTLLVGKGLYPQPATIKEVNVFSDGGAIQVPMFYIAVCPKCGKEFTMRYKNDSTYCYCGLPVRLVLVPPPDKKYWWTVGY